MTDTTTNGTPPDARRLRLHRALREKLGNQVADDLVDFLPPAGWGDLVRRADLDAAVTRLDQKIDALGARLDQKIDALGARLDQKIDALGARLDQRIDALEERLDQKIDALGARLDQRIDALEDRITVIEHTLSEIKTDLRSLGNMKRTIVVTGVSMAVSIILGLGAIGVAFLQVATNAGG
jgi:prefoldin subunit 5